MQKGNSCTFVNLSGLYNLVKPLFGQGKGSKGTPPLVPMTEKDLAFKLVKAAKAGDLDCARISKEPIFIETYAKHTGEDPVLTKVPIVTRENVMNWLQGKRSEFSQYDNLLRPAIESKDHETKLKAATLDAQELGSKIVEEHAGFKPAD